jgi:cation diffusion facilitator family transporter
MIYNEIDGIMSLTASHKSAGLTPEQQRARTIYRTTLLGSAVNFLLVVLKVWAGVVSHSAAMMADAIHSLSDFATDVVVMLFVRISSRPVDKSHDYGHGKFETLATALIGVALFVVGLGLLWGAFQDVWFVLQGGRLPRPGGWALVVALGSILLKELLYQYTVRVARRCQSSVMEANAWHHRSDAFSSVGAALGIGGAWLLGDRWTVFDPLAAFVVSLFILRVAVKLVGPCLDELLEKSLPDSVEHEIEDIVLSVDGVSQPHHLRTRRIGNTVAIEMHVRMNGQLKLCEAHEKATLVERKLKERFGEKSYVGIHVEPAKELWKRVESRV